jgi:hypothetical protein
MTTNAAHDSHVLKPYGLYRYAAQESRSYGHPWRPDLAPLVLAWLEGIPPEDMKMVARIGSALDGGFFIEFDCEHRDTGKPVRVTIAWDHDMYVMTNGGPKVWKYDGIMPYDPLALYCCANTP